MKDLVKKALEQKNWAVLGASTSTTNFGNKIVKALLLEEKNVFPINPKYDEIHAQKVYKDLASVDQQIDVLSVVVNKELAKKMLENNKELLKNVKAIWFQPNTYDDEVEALAREINPNVITGYCVLVETNHH